MSQILIQCLEIVLLLSLTLVEARIYFVLKRSQQEQKKMSMLKPYLITAAVVIATLAVLKRGANLPGIKQVNSLIG